MAAQATASVDLTITVKVIILGIKRMSSIASCRVLVEVVGSDHFLCILTLNVSCYGRY